ncbi:hypothetical protein BDL97_10G060900 [Sphagnum fallax]|nr:hypothetical protein BDL97_10G060900 [Sphagnum fallax]
MEQSNVALGFFPPVFSTSLSLVLLLRSCVTNLIPRLLPRSSQTSLISSPAFDLLVLRFCSCGVEIFTVAGWVRLLEQASDLGAVDRQELQKRASGSTFSQAIVEPAIYTTLVNKYGSGLLACLSSCPLPTSFTTFVNWCCNLSSFTNVQSAHALCLRCKVPPPPKQ